MSDMQGIMDILKEKSDLKAKLFGEKLIFTKSEILGVRTPDMRALIKRILRGEFGLPEEVLEDLSDATYEELVLQGGIIAGLKDLTFDKRKSLIERYVPKIDNWAHCDSFVGSSKFVARDLAVWKPFFYKYAQSNSEFGVRYGVINFMSYYLNNDHIDDVLKTVEIVDYDAYYVKMAVAWTVATALAKYYDKTVRLIEQRKLEKFTHNKAIQKAVESYRITDGQKAYLKTLKIK